MLIKRVSALTGEEHEMDLPVTEREITRWEAGELSQKVWPHLSADQREFIMTGTTPEEWEAIFGKGDN